jgi:hypothetical protein
VGAAGAVDGGRDVRWQPFGAKRLTHRCSIFGGFVELATFHETGCTVATSDDPAVLIVTHLPLYAATSAVTNCPQ